MVRKYVYQIFCIETSEYIGVYNTSTWTNKKEASKVLTAAIKEHNSKKDVYEKYGGQYNFKISRNCFTIEKTYIEDNQ